MAQDDNAIRLISISQLTPSSFAPFGQVIENPAAYPDHVTHLQSVNANQNTAKKWLDITHIDNHYHERAPSRKPAKPVMNMFVCQPRKLTTHSTIGNATFPVKILERHPFTPQTFIPLGVDSQDPEARYLVIVAPTLPSPDDIKPLRQRKKPAQLPPPPSPPSLITSPSPPPTPAPPSLFTRLFRTTPSTSPSSPATPRNSTPTISLSPRYPKGPGGPDLSRVQAFMFRGDQGVTYGPGTWHAPMVALSGGKSLDGEGGEGSKRPIAFVVVQWANGVAEEDCQEVAVRQGMAVVVEGGEGEVKAKL